MATQVGGEKAAPVTKKKKRLDKTFPAPGKEVNQPRALRRVLGHRLFLASLPATLEGAPGTQPVPSEPPNVARRLRWSGPRFRFQHQGQSTAPGPTSRAAAPAREVVAPEVERSHFLQRTDSLAQAESQELILHRIAWDREAANHPFHAWRCIRVAIQNPEP